MILDKSLKRIKVYHDNPSIHDKKPALLIHDSHLRANNTRIILIKQPHASNYQKPTTFPKFE